ncbi:terpenoid synthase [Thozetella sp. PMI_491]|nr:terpenoid synthase [Thozetella sp. PMI_491]
MLEFPRPVLDSILHLFSGDRSGRESSRQKRAHEKTPEIKAVLTPLLKQFDADIGYLGPRPGDNFESLLQGMLRQASEIGVSFLKECRSQLAFKHGLFYAYLCYPKQPLDVRIYAGIFTWLAILVDDLADKDTDEWQYFTQRLQAGNAHPLPLAQAWADYLRLSYKYFSPIAASFIITSALNFTNATTLQGSNLPSMVRTAGGEAWPYYLREKDGVTEAYIWFTFPKAHYPDISCFMEAIPDMNKYIVFVNDILSFCKEESSGERDNYIKSRAFYENRDAYDVLENVVKETVDAHRRIQTVLKGREPYAQAWDDHALGYVAKHKAIERYRLWGLGQGEKYPQPSKGN